MTKRKLVTLTGNRIPSVQPEARHYTEPTTFSANGHQTALLFQRCLDF